jgi:hypothetical protein
MPVAHSQGAATWHRCEQKQRGAERQPEVADAHPAKRQVWAEEGEK